VASAIAAAPLEPVDHHRRAPRRALHARHGQRQVGVTAPHIFTPAYYARMRANEADGWWNAGMRRIAELLLATARLPARGTLADVGCGSGQSIAWFRASHPGWSAVGLDVAMDGLRAAAAGGHGAVLRASALAVPLADARVDLAIVLDVLQHLPLGGGDAAALCDLHRVVRPGGHLLLRTNAQAFPHTPDDPAHDFHKYQPSELRVKLHEAGWRVLRLGRVNALLGLAEIPRELRAARDQGRGYHGILGEHRRRPWLDPLCRRWLTLEGHVLRRGPGMPFGRTILALCQRPEKGARP